MSNLFIYLDVLGPLLGLLYCFTSKGEKAEGYLFIMAFLIAQLLTNGTAKIMMLAGVENNIIVYKLNALMGFATACGWFINHFKISYSATLSKRLRIYTYTSLLILIGILFKEDTAVGLNSLSLSFTAFTVCILAIVYFLLLFIFPYNENLLKSSPFWISTSFFFYYAPCFFVFLVYRLLNVARGNHYTHLWLIQNSLLFICCCILAISSKKRKKWTS